MKARTCLAAFAVFLAGCGGGGGGGSAPPVVAAPPPPEFPPSASFAARCAVPRTGADPYTGRFPDTPGTLADEKAWVRSWIDETYLWYREVPRVDAAAFAGPVDYFNVLKTPLFTASGNPKDRFHFVYDTTYWNQLSNAGIEAGYGIEWALVSRSPPRRLVAAYVDPGTPAAAAGIRRGAEVVAIDGVDFVSGADVATLNAGAFPERAGKSTTFVIRDAGSATPRTVQLTSVAVTRVPVQNVFSIDAPAGRVGYLLFNDHIATAEVQLASAFDELRAAGVTDLVLDMRYNGGGYLDIAAELAYMIAGPARTQGRVFERLVFNDRNPFGLSAEQSTVPFHSVGQGFSYPSSRQLPTLDLGRVVVLTSASTCSASEAVINGLRGVGVDAHLVGGTTCGKPYGFLPEDNCGTTYFAIQFQGVNDQGFGDYGDGFDATCSVPDDFSRPLGDPAEARFAAALEFLATGACPAGTAWTGKSLFAEPRMVRPAARESRILRANRTGVR